MFVFPVTLTHFTNARCMLSRSLSFFKLLHPDNYTMERRTNENESKNPKKCGARCLGPITFHQRAVGDKIQLSQGCHHAMRSCATFKEGLVFSNRPVRCQERIRLRVVNDNIKWHGALRVGFTNVDPDSRSLPLPKLAIPDLTDIDGHWAAPISEKLCQAGTELEFWMSSRGSLYISNQSGQNYRLISKQINITKPLWAMFDVYGQTGSIHLLGSEMRAGLFTRKSCSIIPPALAADSSSYDELSCLDLPATTDGGEETNCLACVDHKVGVALPCGHRCLCNKCAFKIYCLNGTCPLCRRSMGVPSVTWVTAPDKQEDPEKQARKRE
ncbi:E3 ubiquitin-protein ligase NEURL3 [Vanacampus margaritifer]